MRPAETLTDMQTPILPVLTNCYFAPQITGKRSYQLGIAIRDAIEAHPDDLRVAVVGSGGLWHTPGAQGRLPGRDVRPRRARFHGQGRRRRYGACTSTSTRRRRATPARRLSHAAPLPRACRYRGTPGRHTRDRELDRRVSGGRQAGDGCGLCSGVRVAHRLRLCLLGRFLARTASPAARGAGPGDSSWAVYLYLNILSCLRVRF